MKLVSELKLNQMVLIDGKLFKAIETIRHGGYGKVGGFITLKLRDILTGSESERKFNFDDKIEDAPLSRRNMEFLYKEADDYIFMDSETFEQVSIDKIILGNAALFLIENHTYQIELYKEKPVGVVLHDSITLKILETAPPTRGASDSVWKEAKLENGLDILVPLFIAPGDSVRVDTKTGKYISRSEKSH
ncbi:MAG: elongation factor P [Candidatus Hydrogenedentota bacterium]